MKILNISHYYTNPPKSGGQLRVYYLNKELSKTHSIQQFSFTPAFKKSITRIADNYTESIIPVFIYQIVGVILYRILKIPYDFIIPFIFRLVPLPNKLKKTIDECDLIMIEHPWLFSWIYRYLKKKNIKKPLILNSHNVEYDLQFQCLKFPKFLKNIFKEIIFDIEKNALKNSSLIIVVCEEDKKRISKLYKIANEKIKIVENGTNFNYFKSFSAKSDIREKIGFSKKDKIILFAGAGHPPNEEAVKFIERKIAPNLPDFKFIIAGSIRKKGKKQNLFYTGPVDTITDFFSISDIAINPISRGSGSNIKMYDYLAYGLPIISTEFGKRGIKDDNTLIISSLDNFPKAIQNLYNNKELLYLLKKRGPIIAKKHNWTSISNSLEKILISNYS